MMRAVRIVRGIAAPLPTANIDTDQIIPKQFLKTTTRTGLGAGLFHDERRDVDGRPIPGFVLDTPPYTDATILVAGDNFGCGSSREHAPWALLDFGIRAVISTSFADIFANNSANNGLLLARVAAGDLAAFLAEAAAAPGIMTIDLEARHIVSAGGHACHFAIDDAVRQSLLEGRDAIQDMLRHADAIAGIEARLDAAMPWLPRMAAA